MRLLIITLLPLFVAGCFSTPDAGPDTGAIPDDGTVTVDSERDLKDESDLRDEGNDDQTDQSDPADQTQFSDPDLPDTDDALTDDASPDADINLPPVEVYFDDQIRTKVLAALDAAHSSVRFVAYTFSDTGVMTKLNGLKTNGVDVRGVIGTPVEAGTPSFPLAEFADTGDGIVHEKFFVIDGATVLLTSSNIAYQNIKNFLVVFHNAAALAEELSYEFDELAAGRRGAAKSIPCDTGCATAGGTLVITPASCDNLAALLDSLSSGSAAWLAMYTLTDSAPMYHELLALPGRGITLHATLDDWDSGGTPANQTAFDDLDTAGAEVAFYNGSMVFHHKFFVTPAVVEFGSMNWTYSGCQKNDEFYFITEEMTIVQPFLDYAQSL